MVISLSCVQNIVRRIFVGAHGGFLSVTSQPDRAGLVDGGQGNRAGREPEGVDPVPALQQGLRRVSSSG